jgi:hypothetical protein
MMRNGCLSVILALLIVTAPASAFFRRNVSVCRSCNTYQPVQTFAQPTYSQPVYQPQNYVQPAPYYPPYPVQKVIAQGIQVAPLFVNVPVDSHAVPVQHFNTPYYYSVGQAYQEKAYMRDLLREELRNLLGQGSGTIKPGQPQQQQIVTPKPSSDTTAFIPDTTTPLDLQKKVIEAYSGRANCISCHGATGGAQGPKGQPFRLVVEDGGGNLFLSKFNGDKRYKIWAMSMSGLMPPSAVNDASKAMEVSHLPVLQQYAMMKE